MDDIKGQLTGRGIVIGLVGCVIITAASVYTALKMGALPWPIVFAAIVSLFFLKVLNGRARKTSLNEANVTHTIMSAGAMVAGGLAFTIPGIWMLGAGDVSFWSMAAIALSGVVLGLIATVFIRRHFIEREQLEFPIGQAAAQTLKAGNGVAGTGKKLFGAMGFAGVFAALRDWFGVIPTMLFGDVVLPGVTFGVYLSPMMLSVGFLVGLGPMVAWFIGGLLGNVGLSAGASAVGLWDVETGTSIVSSLGMGVMMGAGLAVVAKDILPHMVRSLFNRTGKGTQAASAADAATNAGNGAARREKRVGALPATLGVFAVAATALLICFFLGLGPVPSIVVVALVWVTAAMSAQSVGQSGIDPMEIFGLIVLLAAAALSDLPQAQLFFIAAIIAVSCGLAGDVMNDFKAGYVLGTSPKAQWIGQAIGGVVGALVASAVMAIMVGAYGPDAFGVGCEFVSAQASVVATMVSGIPNAPAFFIGLAFGVILYWVGLPAMMVGLGIYLPFYMTLTAFLGALGKVVYDIVCRHRAERAVAQAGADASEEERAAMLEKRRARSDDTGLVVASGLLGGESIVGVIIALVSVCLGLAA